VWIEKFSRLVYGRTKHDCATFVCNSCLNVFWSQRVLDFHILLCSKHPAQQTVYPQGDEAKLKFNDHDKEFSSNFYLVCDFESFLVPSDPESDTYSKTRIIDKHHVSGFCCYRVTDLSMYQTPLKAYSGPDVMSHFYEHIMSENREINQILSQQLPLSPMTTEQTRQLEAATECANCNCPFTSHNHKVKHHSHITGEYFFASCNNCNLQLKPKKCKVKDADQDANSYAFAIVFHNLQRYDSHFVIKHFKKQYNEKVTKGQKVSFDDVKIIPFNGERFLQSQIGNLKSLDSFQFLSTSLENVVPLLLKRGKENFSHTTKYVGDTPYTFAKVIYP